VAYAVFVLEHVAHPAAFSEAVARVLRPGGIFLAITPNQRHYFGFATWTARRMHVEELLLSVLRDRDTVRAYHVPTEYRLNSIRSVTRHLTAVGFTDLEFRMWDLPRMYEPYLPGPTRSIARAWSAAVYRSGRAGLMGHLTVRAVKAPQDALLGRGAPAPSP
jgi:SAM-dependent methyltransferase